MKLYSLLPALRVLCGAALFFFSLAIPVCAENVMDLDRLDDGGQYVCTYEEHYYDGVGESVFTLQKISNGYLAVWEGMNDTTEVFADEEMRTQKIMITDGDTSLTVKRQGQQLKVSGTDEGERVDKNLKLTSPHWFQLLPFSLISFTTSDREMVKFSMFDPYNIKVRDMQIEKQGTETISMFDTEYTAVKLNMRLRGFLTPFWKSEMWNAADSGTYIKYEGLNVIPKFHKSKIYLKKVEFRPH